MNTMFINSGVIDIRAIKTFGLSAKDKENAIGFFGTGLKYAIAILLREGLEIELLSGGQRYVFAKKVIDSRGKPFEIITMNDEELPFTTKLGVNWKLWQAFREIYCNCLDENGHVVLDNRIDYSPADYQDKTIFVVKGQAFADIYHEKDRIVLGLNKSLQVETRSDIAIYKVPSNSLYYRGIRVLDFNEPAMYTYNLLGPTELTEDRTVKFTSSAIDRIAVGISTMRDKQAIRDVVLANRGTLEHELNFTLLAWCGTELTDEFGDVLESEYKLNNDKMNATLRNFQMKRMNSKSSKSYEPQDMTSVERKQLDRATKICKKVFPDFGDYKILVVKTLGQTTMALADMNEKTMVVSKSAFMLGTKYLLSTLLEEYMHLKTEYSDYSRELQTHLFDTICTIIEDYVIEEPI